MSEIGKGYGWLPKYPRFVTSILTSSRTSRWMVSSLLSPGHREERFVNGGEYSPQVHESGTLGSLRPLRHLRGPARAAVQVAHGPAEVGLEPELFGHGGLRPARPATFEHEEAVAPEREPQRPRQTLRRPARYSAGWRARRPVPSRICSLQLVPGATTTRPSASLTAGKSLLSPIFMETS